jgi:phosphosulfolactate synthase
MPGFGDGFLGVPVRSGTPRGSGLTHVIDKGLGPRGWEDVLDTGGDYISIVKLGWGTAAVTQNLERKLAVLRDKPVVIGGTFFEVVYVQDQLDAYKSWLARLGLTHVELSDGTIDIPRERKLELIADFARDFTVLSEVGSKDSSVEYSAPEWTQWLREELEAGAWKVITEAREGGTAGIFDSSGGMRTELIGEIADAVGLENVVFEAPTKSAQAWFIKQFGPEVNLGNIPPDEVIALETLRLGLRGDTLKEVLLGGEPATTG